MQRIARRCKPENAPVNRRVVGSSPTSGAIKIQQKQSFKPPARGGGAYGGGTWGGTLPLGVNLYRSIASTVPHCCLVLRWRPCSFERSVGSACRYSSCDASPRQVWKVMSRLGSSSLREIASIAGRRKPFCRGAPRHADTAWHGMRCRRSSTSTESSSIARGPQKIPVYRVSLARPSGAGVPCHRLGSTPLPGSRCNELPS